MASAMVNNVGLVAPDGFLDLAPSSGAYSSCGWLSPRISFSHDFDDDEKLQGRQKAEESSAAAAVKPPSSRFSVAEKKKAAAGAAASEEEEEEVDLGGSPGREVVVDFEFRRLDDPVTMLPADELFSDGKLVPLQLASVRPSSADSAATLPSPGVFAEEIRSPELQKMRQMVEEAAGSDQCGALFSPKAPRCSSRLRELFGLKKATHNGYGAKTEELQNATHRSSAARSLRHFLHRSHRSSASIDAYLSLPLLRDSDSDSVSMSARLSLSSSSSSGPDHEELPRLSLDSDKPSHGRNPPRVRLVPKLRPCVDPSSRPNQVLDYRHHQSTTAQIHTGAVAAGAGGSARSPMRRGSGDPTSIPTRGASLDSPRMNSSGKVVFQSLERSSSSPSTFNGGPRVKHRGVAPVLNVPLCSLRGSSKPGSMFGFGQLFASSTQKKDTVSGTQPSWVAARNSNGSSSAVGRNVKTLRSYGEFR
ncbi:unnamed protein product [Spirodela intermedia]|uniref:Uncharacterized protein n=1 Tax=Spirodela intermedia TaxID=51605 RepID=A0A7I8IJ74_SPIIN|nr:unnamed protein product [Spirodela intermedia]CAA6657945.1 unnamed protein product [Spirodela intermedia]